MSGLLRFGDSWPIYLIGGLSFALSVTHVYRLLFIDMPSTTTFVFRDIGPFFAGLAVLVGVFLLYKQKLAFQYQLRILGWFLAGLNTLALIGFFMTLTQQSGIQFLDMPVYLILNSATAGAGIGLIVGLYDVRSKHRDDALRGLHDATQNLLEAESKEKAGQITADAAQSVIQLPLTGFWLRKGDNLELVAMSETAEQVIEEHPDFEKGEGSLAWEVYEKQEPKLFEDLSIEEDVHNPDTAVKSEYIVPVGEHGVMINGSLSRGEFSSMQLELSRLMAVHTELVLDRIERAESLETREQELQKQNERLEQFASVVSHDLRNPINVIDGYLSLARETHAEEDFDEIRTAVDRMEDLVDDLLALARSGESIQNRSPVGLRSVAENAGNNVDLEGLELELGSELGMVEADESRLQQLFENLFRNAVEHAENADTIRVEPTSNGIAIEDNGSGIPEEKQDSIFDYGYTSSDSGTGLGLAIVQEVIEGHNWEISVSEAKDEGARFEIRIPEEHRINRSKPETKVS
ncbi:sensor histidine kinase [Natrarchaeobius chitinivorans]|nr:ATP-binding protein [Natrarchaeobius chitinivorans]